MVANLFLFMCLYPKHLPSAKCTRFSSYAAAGKVSENLLKLLKHELFLQARCLSCSSTECTHTQKKKQKNYRWNKSKKQQQKLSMVNWYDVQYVVPWQVLFHHVRDLPSSQLDAGSVLHVFVSGRRRLTSTLQCLCPEHLLSVTQLPPLHLYIRYVTYVINACQPTTNPVAHSAGLSLSMGNINVQKGDYNARRV